MKSKIVLALLFGILLVSCMTHRNITDRTVTVVKDTTIYINKDILVKLPGDTVKITEKIEVNNGVVTMAPVTYKDGLITATAWVATGNILKVFAYLNQKQLTVNHRDTVFVDKYRTTESKTVTVTQKVIPKAYKTAAWIVGIELLLLLLWLVTKLKPGIPGILTSFIIKK